MDPRQSTLASASIETGQTTIRASVLNEQVIEVAPGWVGALEGALRGYKEINLRAMRLLSPGGVLVTCSCSYHVNEDLFLRTLAEASADAVRDLSIRGRSAVVDDPDRQVATVDGDPDEYVQGIGVPHDVREALLDDPVHGVFETGWNGLHVELDGQAGAPKAIDHRNERVARGAQ